MSATELIAERSRRLTEPQALAVLAYMDQVECSPTLTAGDLRRLPAPVRRRILAEQARQAETVYRDSPDLIAADAEPPLEHA